uniref:Uncharacterized protein n=1 Tax=Kalanchoe fedtschenkoi TaxID=63787 RepID=A0A7N0T0F6_KALFE
MRQGVGARSSSSSRMACHDCGNQAKRDCVYMRCRTCCKSRGFRCQTHVKSTWVPAYRRRHSHTQHHHHQLLDASSTGQQQHAVQLLNPRGPNPTSGLEEGLMFPPEITSSAMFRCVVVRSSEDNVIEQYAYQAAVSIGGHLFKGILYDQGPELSRTPQHQNPTTAPPPSHHHHHQYLGNEGPSSSTAPPPLEAPATAFATQQRPGYNPSPFQTGTHVFFHQ